MVPTRRGRYRLMERRMHGFHIVLAAACITGCGSAKSQTVQPNTTWVNGRGSELAITAIDPDGSIRGTFINKAENFSCRDTPFEIKGWIEGQTVTFSVRWRNATADCRSITSWIGYLSNNRIITDWDLAYIDAIEQRPMIYRGSDFFSLRP